MRLLVIVPCFNEEDSIGQVVRDIRRCVPAAAVLAVNDGSSDRTGAVLASAGVETASIPFNMGIGATMQTGYRYARERGFTAAVQVDGDGQHDPAEMHKILGPIETGEADLVVGSRFLSAGGFESTLPRRLGIRIFSRVLRMLAGVQVTDATSGFRAAGGRALRFFADNYPQDYPEVESLYLAHAVGLRVKEVAVTMRPRAGGTSSITPTRSVYYMVKVLLALFIWRLRRKPELGVASDGV